MLRFLAGLVLGSLASSRAVEAGDVLSLIQSRPVNTWSNGFDGREFTFARRVDAAEEGSGSWHQFQRGCQVTDQFGHNNCAMRWGARNNALIAMRLGTGLHTGDKLLLSVVSDGLTHHDGEHFLARLFDGEKFEATLTCQFCGGSCNWSYKKLENWVSVEQPSVIDMEEICGDLDKGLQKDFVLWNHTNLPWGPFGGEDFNIPWMKMTGDFHIRVAVLNSTGGRRFDETLSAKVGNGLAQQPEVPAPSVALLQFGQMRETQQKSVSLLGVMSQVFGGKAFGSAAFGDDVQGEGDEQIGEGQAEPAEEHAQQEAQAALPVQAEPKLSAKEQKKAAKLKQKAKAELVLRKAAEKRSRLEALEVQKKLAASKKRPEFSPGVSDTLRRVQLKLSTLKLKFEPFYIENFGPSNLTIKERHRFCQSLDSKGGIVCQIPFSERLNATIWADLQAQLEKGDTFEITFKPRIGGVIAPALSMFMKSSSFSLPACGDKDEVAQYKILDKSYDWVPLKCGSYKFRANYPRAMDLSPDPGMQETVLPEDWPEWVKKLLPKHLAHMPPLGFDTKITLKKNDGSTFASFSLEMGLE
eukprot:CAMPEP_0171186858 /NCGR_PEP_ID=MMETSP0790-20130122/17026_1 /TAXON_ID=2925 /ORGANISM="Alexandrium catenella, Strain OF101" /LENGTH=581 /DNA_ID=CAMNT_0011651909 /DNA_START=71 /DNA_END=1816 /DNA_ORIENTATION=+